MNVWKCETDVFLQQFPLAAVFDGQESMVGVMAAVLQNGTPHSRVVFASTMLRRSHRITNNNHRIKSNQQQLNQNSNGSPVNLQIANCQLINLPIWMPIFSFFLLGESPLEPHEKPIKRSFPHSTKRPFNVNYELFYIEQQVLVNSIQTRLTQRSLRSLSTPLDTTFKSNCNVCDSSTTSTSAAVYHTRIS